MNEPSVDKVIEAYVALRDQKAAIDAEVKGRLKDIKANMTKLEGWLMSKANELGVTSLKAPTGTAYLNTSDSATVADWDAVLDYVKTHEAYDLLERRVSKEAVRQYIEANGGVPSGVNFSTRVSIGVRRPTKGD